MHASFIHRQRWNVFKAFLHNMWPPAQLCCPRRQESMPNFQHGRNNSKSNSLCNRKTRVTRTILPSLANKHFGKQLHLPSPKQYTRNLAVTIAWGVWGVSLGEPSACGLCHKCHGIIKTWWRLWRHARCFELYRVGEKWLLFRLHQSAYTLTQWSIRVIRLQLQYFTHCAWRQIQQI